MDNQAEFTHIISRSDDNYGNISVSYTHLDVYKRQMLAEADRVAESKSGGYSLEDVFGTEDEK